MRYPILRPILALSLITLSAASQAQECNTAIAADAPSSRYTVDANKGTALDKQTGLVWKRCAEGQTWQGGGCAGSPAYFTWTQALAMAEQASFAGKTDWRLPNIKELLSLVEPSCDDPAINAEVFPITSFGYADPRKFWSSSPAYDISGYAWFVEFRSGSINRDDRYNSYFDDYAVRLVRAGQ